MDQITIPEWFAGKNILITGGSGFIGRVLIEKLLRSCPKIGTIYMLLRLKKGKNPQKRLSELVDVPLFDVLKRKYPNAISKIVPIEGDVAELGLGLKPKDRKTLIENVNVIFHGAASVRFDDFLQYAIFINMRGTREIVNLGLDMKDLKVFVHISTTYCNCDKLIVEELVYPADTDWKDVIRIAEEEDPHTLEVLTAKFVDSMPNTYTYTKKLGENVVFDLCNGKIPSVILRPSIVSSTMKDPIVGWIDNFNGPVGLFTGIAKGILRVTLTDTETVPDYMPVDVVVKQIIASCWKKGMESGTPDENSLEVYNASSNGISDISNRKMSEIGMKSNDDVPFSNILWYPKHQHIKSELSFYFQVLYRHVLPAILVDIILRLLNRKPRLLKLQRRIYVASLFVNYFMNNTWTFCNDKLVNLKIHPKDRKDFDYMDDFRSLDIAEFMPLAMKGVRQYLLKEDLINLQRDKKIYARMYLLDKVVTALQLILLAWLFFWKFDIIGYISARCVEYFNFSDW